VHFIGPEGWLEKLQKGDHIDLVREEAGLVGWTTGVIEEVKEDSFIILPDGNWELVVVGKESEEISPYGAYTRKNEWRLELTKGDIVDYFCLLGIWVQSTITEIKSHEKSTKAKIKSMLYRKADLTEEMEEKIFEDWVDIFSLRIQKKNSILIENSTQYQKGIYTFDKETINDEKDVLLNSPCNQRIYCVQRLEKESTATVVGLMNILGKEGGFEKMLSKIKEKRLSFGNSKE